MYTALSAVCWFLYGGVVSGVYGSGGVVIKGVQGRYYVRCRFRYFRFYTDKIYTKMEKRRTSNLVYVFDKFFLYLHRSVFQIFTFLLQLVFAFGLKIEKRISSKLLKFRL